MIEMAGGTCRDGLIGMLGLGGSAPLGWFANRQLVAGKQLKRTSCVLRLLQETFALCTIIYGVLRDNSRCCTYLSLIAAFFPVQITLVPPG
jgi:hypothetical protein